MSMGYLKIEHSRIHT